MNIVAQVLIAVVALEHCYIMWLEMFMWTRPLGRKTFSTVPTDMFDKTKALAANQGLYNGFLAAGLAWSLFIKDPAWGTNVASFFLCCIVVAGVFGALTAMKRIFYIQSLPAIAALIALHFF
jgi:putative membrane protein